VKEQIGGDELYADDPASMTGAGFYTVGPNRDMLHKVEDINRVETLIDWVDTNGVVTSRPQRRLRPLPRSQIRSDSTAGLLRSAGHLSAGRENGCYSSTIPREGTIYRKTAGRMNADSIR
jgi:hypothetical protein